MKNRQLFCVISSEACSSMSLGRGRLVEVIKQTQMHSFTVWMNGEILRLTLVVTVRKQSRLNLEKQRWDRLVSLDLGETLWDWITFAMDTDVWEWRKERVLWGFTLFCFFLQLALPGRINTHPRSSRNSCHTGWQVSFSPEMINTSHSAQVNADDLIGECFCDVLVEECLGIFCFRRSPPHCLEFFCSAWWPMDLSGLVVRLSHLFFWS